MNISTFSRPQTAPRLENDGRTENLHQYSISSRHRPNTQRSANRPIRHHSPVPHSFRYAPVHNPSYNLTSNHVKLKVGSKSLRQIPRTASDIKRKPVQSLASPNGRETHSRSLQLHDEDIHDFIIDDDLPDIQLERTGPERQPIASDPTDNNQYHNCRKAFLENASDRDKAALKLGRLILSTVLSKPEVSVADSISRFFTDVWLSKSGTNSTLETTDITSIDLLANLQRSMTAYSPAPDASITAIATSQKSIAAVACEALDSLILTFGKANPILTDIKEALLPLIFMNPPTTISSSFDPKSPLTGQSYIQLPTWCEDTATVIEDLQATQRALIVVRKEKDEVEQELNRSKILYDEMVKEHGDVKGKMLSSTREQERLRDLYRELKKSHQYLEEEHAKLVSVHEADREQHARERKHNSLLAVKLEESKEKYATLLNEKMRIDDLRASQNQEIVYLKSEVGKYKDQIAKVQQDSTNFVENYKKVLADYEEANNYRLDQSRKYQEAIDRIEKALNNPTINFTMGSKVLSLIRSSQQNVIEILECWNVELLERNSVLEAELAAVDVEKVVASAIQAQSDLYEEKLAVAAKTNQSALDALKKTKDAEINQMRLAMDQVRNELFETQIDRNRTEDLVKAVEKELKDLELKFDAMKRELEKKSELTNNTKVRLQDRADMLLEDHMFETLLREQQVLAMKQKKEIDDLVQESSIWKAKLLDVEENLEDANESLAKKITELGNLKATSMEMTADMAKMKERIEILSRPNKREQQLEQIIEQLRSENSDHKAEIEILAHQKKCEIQLRYSLQQFLDRLGMSFEDEIAQTKRECKKLVEDSRNEISSLNTQLKTLELNLKENELLREMRQNDENQLMAHEDRMVKTSLFMVRVLRAQKSLFASNNASFRFENEPLTEFDSADGDDDENHLKELLQKEKDAHARTKEKMKDKMSAELIKQHNLDLERRDAVAQAFRSAEEVKHLQELRKSELHEYEIEKLKNQELVTMMQEDFCAYLWNKKKATLDRFTEVKDLDTSKQPAKTLKSNTNVPLVRIPQAKSTKGDKSKENTAVPSNPVNDEELVDDFPDVQISSTNIRRGSLKSQKGNPHLSRPSPTNRRMSEIHKSPILTKAPALTKSRRGSEFHSKMTKSLMSPTQQTVQSSESHVESSDGQHQLDTPKSAAEPSKSTVPIEKFFQDDTLSALPDDSSPVSARNLPSYRSKLKNLHLETSESIDREQKLLPSLSRKESIAENERLVGLAQERAELLSKTMAFDSSISTQSSSNYFFDILELREKRNIFENSRLKIILREAAGLIKRLEESLSKVALASIHTPEDVMSPNYSIINEMRVDIQENSWIFNLKPEHVVENEVLKDAILIGGRLKTIACYDDDLIALAHCKDVFPDVKCAIGIDKLTRQVESMKKEVEKSLRHPGSSARSRWKSVLYRSDGSIDANMSLTGWTPQEKNEVYAEIVTSMLLELDERSKKFNQEIELLREIIRETERKRSEEEERANKLQQLPQTQHAQQNKEDFEALTHCITDIIFLIQHLTGTDPDDFSKSLLSESAVQSHKSSQLTDRNLYGNSALIWKKIVKRHHETKLRELKGSSPTRSIPVYSMPEATASTGQEFANYVKSLVTEAALMCEKLTEKILYPNGIMQPYENPFHHHQDNSQLLVGDDAFMSQGLLPRETSCTLQTVYLSPELIYQSDRINSEINTHRQAIKSLQGKQKALLNINLDAMKIEAEKYYAGTLQVSSASESILKWSTIFAEGSASLFTREILHRSHPPSHDDVSIQERKEFPVLERRALCESRPTSAQLAQTQPTTFQSILALPDYRRKGSPPNLFTPVLEQRKQKRYWRG